MINVAAQALNRLFPLFAYAYAQRSLGVEAFGYALFAMALVDFTSPFIDGGLGVHGAIVVGRERHHPGIIRELIGELLTIRLFHACIAAIGLWSIVKIFHPEYLYGVFALSFLMLSSAIDSQYVQMGTQQLWKLGLWNSFGKLLVFFPMIFLVNHSSDAIIFAVLMTATNSIFSMCSFVDTLRFWRPKKPALKRLLKTYQMMLPYSLLVVLLFVQEKFDFFMIEALLSKRDVGLYGGTTRIFLSIQSLLPALTTAFGSEMLSTKDPKAFAKQLQAALVAIMLFVFPISVGSWFSGGSLLAQLFDASFFEMNKPFAIMCSSLIVFAPAYVFGIHALITLGRIRFVLVGYSLSVAVGLFSSGFLIPKLGMTGGAISVFFSKLTLALFLVPEGIKLLPRWETIKLIVPAMISAGLMGVFLWILELHVMWKIIVVGGGLYCVCLALFYQKELSNILRNTGVRGKK